MRAKPADCTSVIIVTFNQKGLLAEAIRSVMGQTYEKHEVIIVDNSSTDGTDEMVRVEFPSVLYIRADKNLGFAGGNNLGLSRARGAYIALLNSDAVARPDWLENLVEAMEKRPDVGICASKMLVFGTNKIDSAGDGFSTALRGYKRGEGQDDGSYSKQKHIFGACAGAALYRRKMLDEIGFLDEGFFLIHEDADLNLRAHLSGWNVLYVPGAIADHKVRSSIGIMSDKAVYYTIRNSDFVRIKNIPLGLYLRCLPSFALGMISEFIYFAVKHRKPGLYCKAKMDVIRNWRSLLARRKKIMSMRKVDNKYLYALMTPVWNREFFSAKIRKLFFG